MVLIEIFKKSLTISMQMILLFIALLSQSILHIDIYGMLFTKLRYVKN